MRLNTSPWFRAALVLLACGVGPSTAAGREDDTTSPILLSVAISPTAVDVTAQPDTVLVQITASDDLSGVQDYVTAFLFSPTGAQQVYAGLVRIAGTPQNGTWAGGFVIPRFSEAGDWQLRLSPYDAVNNGHVYLPAELAALGFQHTVSVTSVPDMTAPTLLSVSINPTAVDVTSQPDTVRVQVALSDDLSGVQDYVTSFLYSPSGAQSVYAGLVRVSGTAEDGVWSGDFLIPAFSEAGDWELRLSPYDAVGNGHVYLPAELELLEFPHVVVVTSASDAAYPELLSVSINPTIVDVTSQPDTVRVQIGVRDDLSGVQEYVSAFLFSPTGTQSIYAGLVRVSGTPVNGIWSGDFLIPTYSEAGEWQLRLSPYDAVGNGHAYLPAELDSLGFSHTVRVSTYEVSAVTDVGNDQGRRVRVRWARHPEDAAGAATPIVSYSVWRRIGPYKKSGADPATPPTLAPAAYPPGDWDFVKSVPAHGEWSYNTVCETLADSSIVGGLVWSTFFVRAETAGPLVFFDTQPDSGYSVDNLPPAPPAGLTGVYAAGTTQLEWNDSLEDDFWYYRLYRGDSEGFVPGLANLIATGREAAWVDTDAGPGFYKLSAVDRNGNESTFASLTPGATSDVPGRVAAFRLLPNQPNPFNPRTTIRFELPVAGLARLAVFDVAGRQVRVLIDGALPVGSREAVWDGRDAAGREVASGTYLARLEAVGQVAVIRMMLVR